MVNTKENVSTSLDIFSAFLTSLVEITVFITGCFQCSKNSDYYHKSERDRAWFDNQRAQTEQTFCYINPVATHTINQKDPYELDHLPNDEKTYTNGVDKLNVKNWRTTNRPDRFNTVPPVPVVVLENNSTKNTKYKTEDYKLFAVNVEESYLYSKKKSPRCEGDLPVKFKSVQEIHPKRSKMRSPVAHRKIWHQLSADNTDIDWDNVSFDSSIDDDISLNEYKLFDDIWRSCELENAFIDYNMASLNNHGWNSVTQQNSTGRKSPSEKFEDIFPSRKYLEAKISENVDSISFYDSESDFSLTKTSTCSNFSLLKFSQNIINPEELSELIDICICSNTKENFEYNINNVAHLRQFCDSDFKICGKTYSPKLLYDLVRQIMLDNYVEYPSSAILSKLIPLNNVKSKVIGVIKIRGKSSYEENFGKPSVEIDKVPDFIDTIINGEIKSETKHWQSFYSEANAMKESIYQEIYDDLIDTATNEASFAISKKLSLIKL